ncbi:sulfite exporter TauE/SafE family protein [bacterium AH-315-L21]|nr:sulfite exporter TauE/SafE family protein [bacterium AH-315-L21]
MLRLIRKFRCLSICIVLAISIASIVFLNSKIQYLFYGNDIGILATLTAGIIDGINPCALAMLLFFLTFLISQSNKDTKILFTGILFAMGTFLAYFLAGIGILKALDFILVIHWLQYAIYSATAIMALVLAYMNFRDVKYAKEHDIGKIKLQLSKKNKTIIHRLIKRNIKSKYKYAISFLLGFVVTLAELLCTGQIYLATMVAIASLEFIPRTIHLIVFNLGFITPIIVISYLLSRGSEIERDKGTGTCLF